MGCRTWASAIPPMLPAMALMTGPALAFCLASCSSEYTGSTTVRVRAGRPRSWC